MSKELTIRAIESSASEVFCRDGYDRASLREIANRAGVSLSAIHEYFDSKASLYLGVGRRLFELLESQRRGLLERAKSSGNELDLETVIHCMVAPVVLPEYRIGTEHVSAPARLRTWYETTSFLNRYPKLKDELRASAESWIAVILDACWGLDSSEARLAYCTIASAMFSWESTNHYLDDALQLSGRFDPEQECRLLVSFISAGIRALVRHPKT
jgi:AcrR family transcriptional regulator